MLRDLRFREMVIGLRGLCQMGIYDYVQRRYSGSEVINGLEFYSIPLVYHFEHLFYSV